MNIEQIKAKMMEMTGHTDDPQEGFEQWEQERQAMVEFHTAYMEQDTLLESLGHRIDDLLPKLRSRKGVDWEKVNDVIDDLEKWRKGTVKVHKQVIENENVWKQISFV